ncbi:uncharacterized protein LOC127786522 isoform X2 [Diospyros lotus]|uniref:uncharacterized protein LOC127786522 isoform X2 n=1 Tax=Diospyros lotus TaxID=55363 RepID=UPI002255A1F6|nr:uncharacterized protein LOC127786522 isoform X2 [Diospyros lotus]
MEGEHSRDREVAPALIAVDPAEQSVAVAVGSDLRVFDLQRGCPASLADDSGEPYHKDSIRAISYSRRGKLLVSAGDDKLVKIWSTGTWRCICTVLSEKRVSAVAITNDGLFVCFADKFGVVWLVDVDGCHENQALASKKAVPILSHYCSIITSLEFSPDGRFIVSADRDFKIRVTTFPNKPLDGAHEIQSFCLGHTEFVSCLAFVCASDFLTGFLVSGSGDSTVRLWDIISGSLLDTCEVGAEAGLVKSNGKEEESFPAVTNLCAIPNSSLVAVTIQSLSGIVLLSCNISDKTLALGKVISITGEVFIPTSLGISFSGKLLWVVTGVSNLQGIDSNSLTRVRAVSGFSETNPDSVKLEPKVLEDNDIPCGVQLLEKLQGGDSIEKEVFVATAETLRTAMRNLLVKKQYTAEKREFRKRGRNDRKIKQ